MSTEVPPLRPQSEALQILATEHWSLLATRSLTYQESLGRVSMFLTVLSGAVISLALVAQADRFGPTFISVAIFMLTIVFFVSMNIATDMNVGPKRSACATRAREITAPERTVRNMLTRPSDSW